MIFRPIASDGTVAGLAEPLPEEGRAALAATASMYQSIPHAPPWISYLACEESRAVGICAFVGPPHAGVVEIAYNTFPGNEGRGVATAMAKKLVEVAAAADAAILVTAHTRPVAGPSTRVLEKLGFSHWESVDHPVDGPIWRWRLKPTHPGGRSARMES